MTESVPHDIQVINTRWYWSGNVKDVEWWINTEKKERSNA